MKVKSMRANLIILAGVIAVILAIGFALPLWQKPNIITPTEQIEPLKEKAPALSFTDINGVEHSLEALQGRVVLMNFWASWCAPCVAEMPQLLQLAKDNPDHLTLLLINVDARKEALTGFFTKHNLSATDNVITVWDKDKAISKDVFGTIRYPESIIINPQGYMTQKITGVVDWAGVDVLGYSHSSN